MNSKNSVTKDVRLKCQTPKASSLPRKNYEKLKVFLPQNGNEENYARLTHYFMMDDGDEKSRKRKELASRFEFIEEKLSEAEKFFSAKDIAFCHKKNPSFTFEEKHIMENVIFNELKIRGFDVDVGVVEHNSKDEFGRSRRNYLEVDFVADRGDKRFYIQSVLSIDDAEKRAQETNSLSRINDSFRKIVVVKDDIEPWQDDNGIQYIGVEQFLLDEEWLR